MFFMIFDVFSALTLLNIALITSERAHFFAIHECCLTLNVNRLLLLLVSSSFKFILKSQFELGQQPNSIVRLINIF